MDVALVQVCVDERLNHELLRIQIKHKLAALYLKAQRILIVNSLGGNLGRNFGNTTKMLLKGGDKIVLAAVLHHDDCQADKMDVRKPMEETLEQMASFLSESGISCVLASGDIYTNNNHIIWLEDHHVKGNVNRQGNGKK